MQSELVLLLYSTNIYEVLFDVMLSFQQHCSPLIMHVAMPSSAKPTQEQVPNLLCHQSIVRPCCIRQGQTIYQVFGHLFYLGHAKSTTKGQSAPLVLPQARHAKNGAKAKGQQDELGDGLNLVNCGMYLDVNNDDVSQCVIGSALVYSVLVQCLYLFVHFVTVVFTIQRKPLPVRPHQNHIPKYMKSTQKQLKPPLY